MSTLAGEVHAPDPQRPGHYRRIATADSVTFEFADSADRDDSYFRPTVPVTLLRRPPRRLADSEYTWGRPR